MVSGLRKNWVPCSDVVSNFATMCIGIVYVNETRLKVVICGL